MNLRRTTMTRRSLAAAAITAGLVLTIAGCGGSGGDDDKGKDPSAPTTASADKGGDSDPSPSSTEGKELAEVKGEGGISLIITSATRDAGGFVTVQGSVTNGTGKPWVPVDWRGDESELVSNGGSIAGASLVDQAGKKKYLILRDTEGHCLCTRFTGGLSTGQTSDWYAQFPAPPEGTTKVTFQVGSMPPAPIELTEGD